MTLTQYFRYQLLIEKRYRISYLLEQLQHFLKILRSNPGLFRPPKKVSLPSLNVHMEASDKAIGTFTANSSTTIVVIRLS